MKLESTVQVKMGVPLFTSAASVILLLVYFMMFSTSFLMQPGVEIELPTSHFLLPAIQDPLIVAITGNPGASVYFEDREVPVAQLATRLESKHTASRQVVIMADDNAPTELVSQVIELSLSNGFSVALAASRPRHP